MPKTIASMGFVTINDDDRSYELDIGDKRNILGRFVLPRGLEGMTIGQFQAIATFAGAHPLKLGSTVITEYSNPCPSDQNFTPRKLLFKLSNGKSLSIPFAEKDTVVSTATQIKGFLEQINTDIKVVCIYLDGEEIPNLNTELGVNFDVTVRSQSSGSGAFYSGKIVYSSDVSGNVPGHSIKVTSALGTIPPIFTNVWTNCVGDFDEFPPCKGKGRSKPLEHRRYIVQYQIEPDVARPNEPIFESRELPVNSVSATEIKNCGTLLAAQKSIFCISYKGESNKNVHKAII